MEVLAKEARSPAHTASAARFHAMDSLRAFAMLLGIFLHAAMSFSRYPHESWPIRDSQTHWIADLLILFIHTFRMPLFFLIAGFFAHLLYHRMGFAGFVRHRGMRIVLPFAVSFVIIVPVLDGLWIYGSLVVGAADARSPIWPAITRHIMAGTFLAHLNTAHLWFLYYLIFLYAMAMVFATLAKQFVRTEMQDRTDRSVRSIMRSGWKPMILAVPTGLILYGTGHLTFETPVSLIPDGRQLVAYGIFFGFGWLLHRQPELLRECQRHHWIYMLGALVIAFPAYLVLGQLTLHLPIGSPLSGLLRCSAVMMHALVTWLIIFGMTGFSLVFLNGPNKKIRYVSDSSYWLYLAHAPLIVYLQILLANSQLHGFLKYFLIVSISFVALFASYHLFVRFTVIGGILNGTRHRRAAVYTPPYPDPETHQPEALPHPH